MLVEFDLISVSVYLEIQLVVSAIFSHRFGIEEIFIIACCQELVVLRSV